MPLGAIQIGQVLLRSDGNAVFGSHGTKQAWRCHSHSAQSCSVLGCTSSRTNFTALYFPTEYPGSTPVALNRASFEYKTSSISRSAMLLIDTPLLDLHSRTTFMISGSFSEFLELNTRFSEFPSVVQLDRWPRENGYPEPAACANWSKVS